MPAAPHSPSVVQSEHAEHVALQEQLRRMRDLLSGRAASPDVVAAELRQLIDAILEHFDHEAADEGFFAEMIARDPRLQHRVSELLRDHFDLRAELIALERRAGQADGVTTAGDDLIVHFARFEQAFRRHESAEADLLESVYCEDLGTGAE